MSSSLTTTRPPEQDEFGRRRLPLDGDALHDDDEAYYKKKLMSRRHSDSKRDEANDRNEKEESFSHRRNDRNEKEESSHRRNEYGDEGPREGGWRRRRSRSYSPREDYPPERRERHDNDERKAFHGGRDRYRDSRNHRHHQRDVRDSRDCENPSLQAGAILHGKVVRIESYGAFVQLGERQRGLVHISQLAPYRVDQVTSVVQMDQELYCRVLEVDQHRIRLSLIGINPETGEEQDVPPPTRGPPPRGRGTTSRHLERRAEERMRLFHSQKDHTWHSQSNAPETRYMHLLWAVSPEPPRIAQETEKEHRSSGRKRSYSTSTESSSESSSSSSSESSSSQSTDSRRQRRRKGRSSRRSAPRSSRRHRHRRRRSYSSSSDSGSESSSSSSSSSSSEESRQEKRKQPPKEITTRTPSEKDCSSVVVDPVAPTEPPEDAEALRQARDFKAAVQGTADSDDDSVGPQPLPQSNAALAGDHTSYGKALLPGEGQAIAQYVRQNLRVPRRGEIGYGADEIDRYEKSGYVMSGSRHARMNAVRLRKENQVYSAEEQRALALITMEEKQQKEAALMEDFRRNLKEKRDKLQRTNPEEDE